MKRVFHLRDFTSPLHLCDFLSHFSEPVNSKTSHGTGVWAVDLKSPVEILCQNQRTPLELLSDILTEDRVWRYKVDLSEAFYQIRIEAKMSRFFA